MTTELHPDDCFHPPTTDDPYWTETCWFTFAVPERRLSGQLYPFFRPNQGVYACGVYLWDDQGDQLWNALYTKNFWHLPMPDQDLCDIQLANGLSYRCLESQQRYALNYLDPDNQEVEIQLTFDAMAPPNYLMDSHLDQPGRYTGTIRIGEEIITVDNYGMRDRSWSVRDQFGPDIHHSSARQGGYSYATIDNQNAFHAITMAFEPGECIVIHGYHLRDGEYAKLVSGCRRVIERDKSGCPTRILLEARDELGRDLHAEGRCINKIAVHLNPNLFTWNCLTEWTCGDVVGWGEDHDNWRATAARHFFRNHLGFEG